MNDWSEQLNVPYPSCNQCACCCKCASSSSPRKELERRAKDGDSFARDFLDIFIPYNNIEDAKKFSPSNVENSFKAAQKPNSKVKPEELIFYHCKYVSKNNKCLIYEDRPQLCRDYPDSPFLVFSDDCAFKNWSKQCKINYKNIQEELKLLKKEQELIKSLKYQHRAIQKLALVNKINNPNYKFIALLPQLSILSPKSSWLSKNYFIEQ